MAEDLGPRIGAFGDPVAITPNIDRLAAQGVRYPNNFTTAGVCAPSRAALLTGLHQNTLGAGHMRTSSHPERPYRAVPPAGVKAFPELLRRAGYWTYTDLKLDYQFSGVWAGSGPFTIWDAEGLTTHWRDRPDGRPFFGLVNLGVTHESAVFPRRTWPRSLVHLYFQLIYLWQFWGHEDVVAATDVTLPPYWPDHPAVRGDLARHYNNVHRMDEMVGEILAELESDGLSESTIVLWTTDHGDGLPRHKRELYDSGIRVPLIVRWPESLRPAGLRPGDVDERLVSFVDLAPTLLGWAGVGIPDGLPGGAFAGEDAVTPRQLVYAAKDRIDERPERSRAVRDVRFKYIRNDFPEQACAQHLAFRDHLDMVRALWDLHADGALEGPQRLWFEEPRAAEELYDTQSDPHEIRNLATDPAFAATLARLRRELDDWLARSGDLGLLPEDELIERFWPGGTQPVTPKPAAELSTGSPGGSVVTLTSETPGASLGYRLIGGERNDAWRLYVDPVRLEPGESLEAKAVRYGWAESEPLSVP
jgi:arylsulfatase A-like enzyme